MADLIEGVAGELSPFEELHGFSIDGVDLQTAVLPDGWRDRLVKVQNANTAAPDGQPQFTGLCLDKEDLCAAKLVAFHKKDRNFVAALIEAGLVDPDVIVARLSTVSPNARTLSNKHSAGWPQSANNRCPVPANSLANRPGRESDANRRLSRRPDLQPRSGRFRETHWPLSRCSCEGACMANGEVLNRAAEVNEQFRTIELTAETVTRPAGPQTPTVHSFLRHLRAKGLNCVP